MHDMPATPPPWWSAFIEPSGEERTPAAPTPAGEDAKLESVPQPGGDTASDQV